MMKLQVNEGTLQAIKTALESALEPVESYINGGEHGTKASRVWYKQDLQFEAPNAMYLIGYNGNFEIEVEVHELKPSYARGYEWMHQQTMYYVFPEDAIEFVISQEAWYNSF